MNIQQHNRIMILRQIYQWTIRYLHIRIKRIFDNDPYLQYGTQYYRLDYQIELYNGNIKVFHDINNTLMDYIIELFKHELNLTHYYAYQCQNWRNTKTQIIQFNLPYAILER